MLVMIKKRKRNDYSEKEKIDLSAWLRREQKKESGELYYLA